MNTIKKQAKFLNNTAGPNVKTNDEKFVMDRLQQYIVAQLPFLKDIEEHSYVRGEKDGAWRYEDNIWVGDYNKTDGSFVKGGVWKENWIRVTKVRKPTELDVVENLIESSLQTTKKHRLTSRAPITQELKENDYIHGWTMPGYNYCGPGNSLNLGCPTSVLDAMCMVHDIKYAYQKSEEIDDDKKFLVEITNWAKAKTGQDLHYQKNNY